MATVEMSGDRQAGVGSGGANEVENLLIAVERLAGPVWKSRKTGGAQSGSIWRRQSGMNDAVSVGIDVLMIKLAV